MADPQLRLFVAIELPDGIREALALLQKHLQTLDQARVIRWTVVENIHLTLKFIGETEAANQEAIARALGQAASALPAFDLVLDGVGCFPNTRRPRVVWAGLGGSIEALHALRNAVERTIAPLGFPTEAREFSPHLTLGRAKQDSSAAALAALGKQIETLKVGAQGTWRVQTVSLMKSDLKPSGAVYTRLTQVALSAHMP